MIIKNARVAGGYRELLGSPHREKIKENFCKRLKRSLESISKLNILSIMNIELHRI